MSITLNGLIHEGNTPIAVPAFRICLALKGAVTDADNAAALVSITRAFLDQFGDQIGFVALSKASGRPARLTKPTAAKMQAVADLLEAGLDVKTGLRLYGPDTGPLGKPAVPFLSFHQMYPGLIIAELALPPDDPATQAVAAVADQALRDAQVMVGMMGFGFFSAPTGGLDDLYLPPAHNRFRAAIMGRWAASPQTFMWQKIWDQKYGGYRAGLPDMGWRTYVGDTALARLKDPDPDLPAEVTIETTDRVCVVTVGSAPIWGDVNAGEDIASYRAAYAYLAPAFADRVALRPTTLGGVPTHHPARGDVIDSYLDRFA